MPKNTSRTTKTASSWSSPTFIVLQLLICGACLSFGFFLGSSYAFLGCTGAHEQQSQRQPARREAETMLTFSQKECDARLQSQNMEDMFPENVHEFAEGMAFIGRDDFNKRFDMGVPLDPSNQQNNKVLLLYGHNSALPSDKEARLKAQKTGEIPTFNVFQGIQNCDVLNVVFMQPKRPKHCTAIMGQYPSFHVQKWMRLPNEPNGEYGKLDSSVPLQIVNRGAQNSGRKSFKVPTPTETRRYWKTLKTYLETLPDVLQELRPIAAKVAKQNTVVVSVVNHGQSELLLNFACAAKSRGLDISSILVFATDEITVALAEGIGLTVFFDKTNYGKSPIGAAGHYGDATFTAMMMAKIYCVQMVSNLGYDVLFQDVDIVWYKNPLEFFHDEKSPSHGFDIYFQDDGNRALFYAPYSANTGFYYVRANDVTQYFFNSLLMSGDLIFTTNSHQIALVAILSEYASRYGMKAKVLPRETEEFPGGYGFHNRKEYMKDLVQGKVSPYLFHMSWTENKDNKKLYFRQLGEWYVEDKCIANTAGNILGQPGPVTPGSLVAPCCSTEAIFSCHYRDKPSREPCPNAPFIDAKNGKSFW